MATITEDYVSFEIAKLLKEKGFDEGCFFVVNAISKGVMPVSWPTTNSDIEDEKARFIALPTLQMAMKWLREVHGLFISIGNDDLDYNWQIFDIKNRTKDLNPICLTDSYGGYKKYETACEEAIKYCLEENII